jgi:hypothetical protein
MLRAGLRHDPQFQKLQSVLAACEDLGARPILVGEAARIEEVGSELDCDLAWMCGTGGDAPTREDARELAFAV